MPRLITALTFAGLMAGASIARADSNLKLLVWINADKGYNGLQKVGDLFTAASGVKVKVEHPEGATDKFQQATAAGKGPDIFCWPHDRLGEWAKGGLLVPIRPSKKIKAEIEDTAWRAFTFKGKVWGYPIAIEANGLIYNKALVPIPPSTFDDVIALDKTLKVQGKQAILWDYNKSFFTWALLAGAGGSVFARDAKGDADPSRTGVNAPGAMAAAGVLEGLIKNGQMPRGARYANMEAGFNRGEIAMMISGPWAWDNAKKSRIDFGVAPIPGIKPGQPSRPFVGVLGCMIASPSKYKDLAREFLESHVLKPGNLKIINDDVPLGVPANKALYQQLSTNPHIKATMDNARLGEPVPNIPEMGRFWSAMDAALEAITNGLQAPDAALNAAAARITAK